MRYHPLALIALLLALNSILVYAIAAPDNSSDQPLAAETDDSGFRPESNGFSFQNYGEDPSIVDLTPVEMQRMFGDKVCASKADGKCVLTYPAKRWMDEAVAAMAYGHCEGIAVLSDLIYFNQLSSGKFGGNSTINLSLQNELLQREIGYWWVTQVTTPGGTNKVSDSPNEVLDVLADAFDKGRNADEWWVMGIYLPDGSGGHSITPFAVEDMGNGIFRILVYDNNWPKERRFIEVDRNSNSWRYVASINPNEPSEVYTGNASTKSLEIVSVSSRLVQQECDFCAEDGNSSVNSSKGALKGQKNIQIWQNGRANALVTNEHGQRIGFLESGEFVNEIPDAKIRNLRFGFGMEYPPVIFVPVQSGSAPHLTINISSKANNDSDEDENRARTTVIAPGLSIASFIPDLKEGQQQSIDLMPAEEGYTVNFSSNQALSPTISMDTDFQKITLSGINIDPLGSINIGTNPVEGSFSMKTIGNINPGTLQLQSASINSKSGATSTFHSTGISLRPNDGLSLNFANPMGNVGIPSLNIAHENGDTENVMLLLEDTPDEAFWSSFDLSAKEILSDPYFAEAQKINFTSSFGTPTSGAGAEPAGSKKPPRIAKD